MTATPRASDPELRDGLQRSVAEAVGGWPHDNRSRYSEVTLHFPIRGTGRREACAAVGASGKRSS
jgi:hypothetical protein